jgi:Tfp pilus assembly PilM family ATPase
MLSALCTSTPAIGLDVGSESIKLLQLGATGAGLKVAAARRILIPDNVKGDPDRRVAFAADMLWPALRSGTFVGRRVIAAVPKELLHYKTHRLPPMAADDVAMAGRIDARDLFRFDPDATDYQCIDAGEVRQSDDHRHEVILVAAGKKYLDQFVNALHGAGGRVASLDIDPCAVWRAAGRLGDDPDHPRVLLDVGGAQCRLVIGRDGQIRLIKTIDVGAGTVKSNEGARHLAREVLKCLRHHAATFGGPPAKRIELVGGNAAHAQIRLTLASTLLLPVRPLNVFRGIDISEIPAADRTENLGEWAVALGLAMKGLPGALSRCVGKGLGEGLASEISNLKSHISGPSPQPSPGVPGEGAVMRPGVRP